MAHAHWLHYPAETGDYELLVFVFEYKSCVLALVGGGSEIWNDFVGSKARHSDVNEPEAN